MNVAIYVRVSTDDQSERKTIDSQIEFANKYCDLHELPIFKIYKDDGITGTLPLQDRPAGSQLIQDAKNKCFDTLLVYKLDRLGRATRVILNAIHDLEGYGIKLKSMTEPFDTGDASGRFLLTILAGVADLERSNILERMWHGSNRAAREGKWLGGIVPYGYIKNNDKMLEINEIPLPSLNLSEADVIRLIYKLTVDENMTTIKIADYLNALNIPPSYVARSSPDTGRRKSNTAGIWTPGRVLNMLRSSTYKGIHQYGKRSSKAREIIERSVPAIIDENTWEAAQEIISGHFLFSQRSAKTLYILRNLIKCGNCGYNYHGTISKGSAYYTCNGRTAWKAKGRKKCYAKSITMSWLDDLVWNDCLNYINNPDLALKEIELTNITQKDTKDSMNDEIDIIIKQLEQKDVEKESILDLFRKKFISSSDVEKQLEKINREILALKDHQKNTEKKLKSTTDIFSVKSDALNLLNQLKEKINSTDSQSAEFKREIIMILVDQIIIFTTLDDDDKDPQPPQVDIQIHFKFGSKALSSQVSSKIMQTQLDIRTGKGSWRRSA